MDLTTPSWAKRHNYFHHSNPRSKDRAKNIFEKPLKIDEFESITVHFIKPEEVLELIKNGEIEGFFVKQLSLFCRNLIN